MAQGEQVLSPSLAEYPTGHTVQLVPLASGTWPGLHEVQTERPLCTAVVPPGQREHDQAPALLYCPAWQATGWLLVCSGHDDPAGQDEQTELPSAFAYVPGPQLGQVYHPFTKKVFSATTSL